jgi:DNA repair protein RadD
MTFRLREYQQRAIEGLRASYAAGHRAPCLVAPTGSGKTIIGSEIVRLSVARGKSVLFNAHREELIDQTIRKLADAGISGVRRIQASKGGYGSAPVTVASVQTLARWPTERLPKADFVVFDECHHGPAKTWTGIADGYRDVQLLGLTATPERADGRSLNDMFDDLVVAASVSELTELGHLVPCRIWAPPKILETGEIAVSPVAAYQQHGQDGKAIAFCSTLERAGVVAAEFNAAGITSTVIHGDISSEMRKQIIAWFREGQIRVLVSVHVLTEGFDEPSASVCILERKPAHAGTYLQMVGRVLRPSPGKTGCTVIDLCGSSLVHGTPGMERMYSLDGRAISKPERESIRQCPSCGGVFLTADMEAGCCPQCGVEMPRREIKAPRITGIGLTDASNTNQLRINLQAVARRTRRTAEWVTRAHDAIAGRKAS